MLKDRERCGQARENSIGILCPCSTFNSCLLLLVDIPSDTLIDTRTSFKQKMFDPKQKRHVCSKGEKVLFVRHPILRLISAWNDKFSLHNNNVKSGLEYGVRLIRGWRSSFPDDYKFLIKAGFSEPLTWTAYQILSC